MFLLPPKIKGLSLDLLYHFVLVRDHFQECVIAIQYPLLFQGAFRFQLFVEYLIKQETI